MKVRGTVLRARIGFVKDKFGEQAWTRVLEALPEDDAKFMSGIITHGAWYPFDISVRLDDAIVNVLGGGQMAVFEDIGRASAKENLSTVHGRFLDPRDPMEFLKKTPIIYSFYYDTGRRTFEATGPTSGVLTTFDAETFSKPDCATVIGWHKQGLEMAGARDVQMVEEECRAEGGKVCRYRVSWK